MTSNVHEREYPVAPERLGALLDTVAGPEDRVWPSGWPPIRFDRPLAVGARGGHGMIRYSVIDYRPGKRVEFRLEPMLGLVGTHGFEILPGQRPDTSVLRHVLVAHTGDLRARVVFPLTIEKLHDAVLEDLLDRVGTELGEPPARPARWSPWVRFLRFLIRRKPTPSH